MSRTGNAWWNNVVPASATVVPPVASDDDLTCVNHHVTVVRIGSQPGVLTPDKILDAALELVDATGPDGLTMRRLADRLGVTATAIYHYFDGREAILEALLDRVCGIIVGDAPHDGPWDVRLKGLLTTMVDHGLRATPANAPPTRGDPRHPRRCWVHP